MERDDVICPTDESLRELLKTAGIELLPADWLSHLKVCDCCRQRAATWGELPRLEELLRQPTARVSTAFESLHKDPLAGDTISYHEPPRVVGNYELVGRIGRGGGGEVFEAVHRRLRRRVAVKLLASRLVADEHARQRFLREMESIGRLNHPHIVQAHDAGESQGVLYLAMELIDGPDVETLARRAAPVSVANACEIVRQAALGLQHIHEQGLVHRDLKPSNLLLSSTGVKVADLGMALLDNGERTEDRLTGSCVIMGTGDYMAPEQTDGARYLDIRADLYSLGCTLYRLLAGQPPFAKQGNGAVMKKLLAHSQQAVPDVASVRSDIPTELKSILEKLLAKRRDDRHSAPSELAADLLPFCIQADLPRLLARLSTEQDVSVGQSTPPVCLTDPPTTRRQSVPGNLIPTRRRGALLAGALLLITFGALWHFTNHGSQVNTQMSAAAPSGKSSSLTGAAPPSISENEPSPARVPVLRAHSPQILGKTALRWQKEFGTVPATIQWAGQSGAGSWHFDDQLNALLMQTVNTSRFIHLGELSADKDEKVTIGVDCLPQHPGVMFGIFLGFQVENSDQPRYTQFQAFDVYCVEGSAMPRRVAVRRYRGRIDAESGVIGRNQTYDKMLLIDRPFQDPWRFELQIVGDRVESIRLCEHECASLYVKEVNQWFAETDFRGAFGLRVENGTVWYRNPLLVRKQRGQ